MMRLMSNYQLEQRFNLTQLVLFNYVQLTVMLHCVI